MSPSSLTLASASPRRRDLLTRDGYRFDIVAADIDETLAEGETPLLAITRIAAEKAIAVAARVPSDRVLLAADTSVLLDDLVLGKPDDEAQAVEYLLMIAGRNHQVLTAWSLLGAQVGGDAIGGGMRPHISGFSVSTVRLRDIGRREAERYAAGGEPMDKAGAYAVQGEGRRFIVGVLGSLDNVIGLPCSQLCGPLAELGVTPQGVGAGS